MQRIVSWPVQAIVAVLLIFAVFVDGAGFIYRAVNHYPLTGNAPDLPPHFGDWQVYIHRGLDLSGGTHLEYQMTNFPPGQNKEEVTLRTIDVIRKRVDALGVSEPYVASGGGDRLIIELAGVSSDRAQQVIGKTAQLVITTWVKDETVTGGAQPGYRPKISPIRSDALSSATASLDQNGVSWAVNTQFNSSGADAYGKLTSDAYNTCPSDPNGCPTRHVAFWLDLTQEDIDRWSEPSAANLVSKNTDSPGGKLLTDPLIINPITGGNGQITGNFTQQTAKDLATLLNSGALPVRLGDGQGHTTPLLATDISASLGADSIKRSLFAGLLGLLIVIIFMISYYRLPGLLASLALVFYAGVALAIFKVLPVTLTLAGLAGFILSVGMAVDANVLIFERFKEEMRAGRTIGAAVDAAIRRAWPAVRDSNISTLITSAILVLMGAAQVKGFAVTLGIGVVVSLISAIIVTHNLLALVLTLPRLRGNTALMGVQRGRAH
jgi:preprotein translocase subunit SecD